MTRTHGGLERRELGRGLIFERRGDNLHDLAGITVSPWGYGRGSETITESKKFDHQCTAGLAPNAE
jgi:hypothetical protein